jgi:hypothetical protein
MKCALCKIKEADKTNTHYLTDSIIRSCLNQGGENEREKGYYFDISSDKTFTEFNFQRNTTLGTLEAGLGRLPSDEEIEKAKKIPFSVDNVFCSKCESVFTGIEDSFNPKYLSQLREPDMTGVSKLSFDNSTVFRLFFLMQVWRTAVCTNSIFKISSDSCEKLRQLILKPEEAKLKEFPLSITYLTTRGDLREYTKNFVGYASGINPNIIFMNDFVIQFYEPSSKISFSELFGINEADFNSFVNLHETKFIVKIISNDRRKQIVKDVIQEIRVKPVLSRFRALFVKLFKQKYGIYPSEDTINAYIQGLVDWKDLPLIEQLSGQRVTDYTNEFFRKIG